MTFLATYLASLGNILSVRNQQEKIPVLQTNAYGMGYGALLTLLIAMFTGTPVAFDWSVPYVSSLLYLAVFGSAVTFSLYFWLLAHMPATRVSIIAYLIPLVAVGVGAAAFDEPLTARTVAGSLLVVIGVALTVRGGGRARPRA